MIGYLINISRKGLELGLWCLMPP